MVSVHDVMCGGQRITLELGLSPSTFIPGLEFSSPGLHGKSLYPRSEPSKQPLLLFLNEQTFTLGGKNVPKPPLPIQNICQYFEIRTDQKCLLIYYFRQMNQTGKNNLLALCFCKRHGEE